MLPFIIGGKESVILQKPSNIKKGAVVLARVDGGNYVVHRIVRIDGQSVTLMGDGNIAGVENCTISDVKAIATHVVREGGEKCYLYDGKRRLDAKIWSWLRPIRKYLLAIYKRI